MHFQFLKHVLTTVFIVAIATGECAWGQSETTRKTKNTVTPAYPLLAKQHGISGVVKVEVIVAPNGVVKEARLLGGNPILANAALDAVKQIRYETRPEQSTETVEFHFMPPD
ncbi:MAG: energy transducer TonB [Terriglobales bacterium]